MKSIEDLTDDELWLIWHDIWVEEYNVEIERDNETLEALRKLFERIK